MKAAFIDSPGPPDAIRYGELPTPVTGEGEILIRVLAAALNPIDLYVRAGTVAMPIPRPFISGCDFAGVVDAVGPRVSRFHPTLRIGRPRLRRLPSSRTRSWFS